ncbi:MAG TPA: hypothetical protein VIH78_18635 [Terriglobales bacterium]
MNGDGWLKTTLYSFTGGEDGGSPGFSGVIFDGVGNLYGTLTIGGANGEGVVFELTPTESGWTETVLYSFCSEGNCADGSQPETGVVFDGSGNL